MSGITVLVAFGPEHARNTVGKLKLRAMYKAESWPDIVGKPEDIRLRPDAALDL